MKIVNDDERRRRDGRRDIVSRINNFELTTRPRSPLQAASFSIAALILFPSSMKMAFGEQL